MAALPTGTITFLFTDIEGSTRLLQRLGPDYAQALREHQALLRAAFTAHGGAEVDTQGDAFFVAFPTAPQAVAAAAQATRALAEHRWPEGATLRVRIGLHTGAPQLVGDHYVGLDVHRAARIAAAGHGGQILLSAATRELVAHALPPSVTLRAVGAHRLKDLQEPEPLYQVVAPGLPASFPPLKTLDTHQHNLPLEPTPMLGREEQLAALCALLRRADVRLVTLTGPGGIGKTRLAVQVAAELIEDFADGVWFVRLSRLSDPALVIPTIAQTLGLQEQGSQPFGEILRAHLAEKRLLLVLDNFEQVLGAVKEVAGLLAASPGLRVLVTSRQPLHLRGERVYAVPSLPLAMPQHLPPLEQMTQYAAVALFVERAQAARSDFTVTSANAPAIAEICARLDGLPLAIELAAARVRVLPPEALLGRLASQLTLLTGGARDLEERQQTMRAAIAGSEDLLAPEERPLFRRLAVFVGGATLEAVEAVCVAPEGAEPLELDPLEGLSTLVEQSLVQQREEGGGEPRFGMLRVIREYALERLEASGEADALRQAHAGYFLARTQRLIQDASATPQRLGEARQSLRGERDDLRAVLDWARTEGKRTVGIRLMAALARFWIEYWHVSEARMWVNRLLEHEQEPGDAQLDRDESSGAASLDAWVQLSSELAQRNPQSSRGSWKIPDHHDNLDNEDTEARIEFVIRAGAWALLQQDFGQAALLALRGLDWAWAAGDRKHVAEALVTLGWARMRQGDLERGVALAENGIALQRQPGSEMGLSSTLATHSYILFTTAADEERVAAVATEAYPLSRQEGDTYAQIAAGVMLAMVAARRREFQHARALAREALALAWTNQEEMLTPMCLLALVIAAAQSGESRRAAYLLGASHTLMEQRGISLDDFEVPVIASCIAQARSVLGEEDWLATFAAGHALTLEQAIAEALSDGGAADGAR
ncbi:MAG TPA: adenylate/guanylate cyclase domain-containing protein [Ktedonobacterales bacterium]